MDDGLKKRLLGATVLVSLAVIFVPMLFEKELGDDTGIVESSIPLPPQEQFSSAVLPLENEDLSRPPAQITPLTEIGNKRGMFSDGSSKILTTKPEQRPEPKPLQASIAPDMTLESKPLEKDDSSTNPDLSPIDLSIVPSWVVQVGSFSNRSNADKITSQLKKKGYPTFIEQADINGNTVFRVRVGPETDKSKARQMLAQLDRDLASHKLKGSLKRYP